MKLLLLLVAVAGLAATWYAMEAALDGKPATPPRPAPGIELPAVALGDVVKRSPASAYADITRKALFNAERRVEAAPRARKPVTPPKREEKLDLLALGIAVNDDGFLAVVKNRRSGEIRRMRINERLDGWELVSIDREGFTFNKAGREAFIPFKQKEAGQ